MDGRMKRPPMTINEVLGKKEFGPYKTDNEADYAASIERMNLSDLQAHAIKCGIRPGTDRKKLIARLLKEFKTSKSSYLAAVQIPDKIDKKKRDEALEALKHGKN